MYFLSTGVQNQFNEVLSNILSLASFLCILPQLNLLKTCNRAMYFSSTSVQNKFYEVLSNIFPNTTFGFSSLLIFFFNISQILYFLVLIMLTF